MTLGRRRLRDATALLLVRDGEAGSPEEYRVQAEESERLAASATSADVRNPEELAAIEEMLDELESRAKATDNGDAADN